MTTVTLSDFSEVELESKDFHDVTHIKTAAYEPADPLLFALAKNKTASAVIDVDLQNAQISKAGIHALLDCVFVPTLERLDLYCFGAEDDEAEPDPEILAGFIDAPLHALKFLDVSSFQLTEGSLEPLGEAEFRNLETLRAGFCEELQDDDFIALVESEHLATVKHLALFESHTPLTAWVGKGPWKLESLDFRNCKLGDRGMRELVDGMKEWSLRELDLSGCQLSDESIELLIESNVLTNVIKLQLAHNDLTPRSMALLVESGVIGQLQEVNTWGMKLGDSVVDAVYNSPIQNAQLFRNDITSRGAAKFASSETIRSNVTKISFYGNPIGDDGVTALCTEIWPVCTDLTLGDVGLTPAGVVAFHHAAGFANLETLDIGYNALGSDGIANFAQSTGLVSLESLTLYNAEIDDNIALLLNGNFPKLRRLFLSSNPITANGVIALVGPDAPMWKTLVLNEVDIGLEGVKAIANSPKIAEIESLQISLWEKPYEEEAKKILAASTCLPESIKRNYAY